MKRMRLHLSVKGIFPMHGIRERIDFEALFQQPFGDIFTRITKCGRYRMQAEASIKNRRTRMELAVLDLRDGGHEISEPYDILIGKTRRRK